MAPDSGPPLFGVDLDHIESWLDEHPELRAEVVDLVLLASGRGSAGDQGTAAHVACTVLVSVVRALSAIELVQDRVVGSIADAVKDAAMSTMRECCGSTMAEGLEPVVADVAVRAVDAVVPELGLVEPELLTALRLAALLACPDPQEHTAVDEHCRRSLALAVVESEERP
ncbi:hypothetical protein [Cellulomonas uda]|uniref:Uncharacterized protein n=1 Tax=Cellulomonas uda TaxID=1714 RepID=A0A4Y3KF04_CELUD|nr:hypothetical protein [Cellulomonas uda]NII67234.1 hypothetical protein [Cellulomonas uda]GEA81578.1 hypothetical protein CUD01_20220 [Cellulomonas uda]